MESKVLIRKIGKAYRVIHVNYQGKETVVGQYADKWEAIKFAKRVKTGVEIIDSARKHATK